MVRLIALVISIVLQIFAATIAIRFIKLTSTGCRGYFFHYHLCSCCTQIIQLFEHIRGLPHTPADN